jgi:hypothetical protein
VAAMRERGEGNASRGPGSTRRRAAIWRTRTTWAGQLSNDFGGFLPGWMHPSCHPPAQGPDAEHTGVVGARAARLAGAHALCDVCAVAIAQKLRACG